MDKVGVGCLVFLLFAWALVRTGNKKARKVSPKKQSKKETWDDDPKVARYERANRAAEQARDKIFGIIKKIKNLSPQTSKGSILSLLKQAEKLNAEFLSIAKSKRWFSEIDVYPFILNITDIAEYYADTGRHKEALLFLEKSLSLIPKDFIDELKDVALRILEDISEKNVGLFFELVYDQDLKITNIAKHESAWFEDSIAVGLAEMSFNSPKKFNDIKERFGGTKIFKESWKLGKEYLEEKFLALERDKIRQEGVKYIIEMLQPDLPEGTKINYKETQNYISFYLNDLSRKWICRLYTKTKQPKIEVKGQKKKGIDKVEDIFAHKKNILAALSLGTKNEQKK